jgi:hypothetical protein
MSRFIFLFLFAMTVARAADNVTEYFLDTVDSGEGSWPCLFYESTHPAPQRQNPSPSSPWEQPASAYRSSQGKRNRNSCKKSQKGANGIILLQSVVSYFISSSYHTNLLITKLMEYVRKEASGVVRFRDA